VVSVKQFGVCFRSVMPTHANRISCIDDDAPWIQQPLYEKLVLESDSRNLHPDARSAACICTVKLKDRTPSLHRDHPLHPYIIRQFAATENYIFTEHCVLGSLNVYLRQDTIVPVIRWATQLCGALSYLHSEGFVHGNLIPSSVYVAEGGTSLRSASVISNRLSK
jgi:hypothetical protein